MRHRANQADFVRHRPVLSNRRLEVEFGHMPEKTSEEAVRFFVEHARARRQL